VVVALDQQHVGAEAGRRYGRCGPRRPTAYDKNILVNVMAVGLVRADRIFRAKAEGPGNPVLYVGSKTGRDGIHGASMASDVFDDEKAQRRPTVQVGDPFVEKLLLEAVLEVLSGVPLALTYSEHEVLHALMRAGGRLLSRQELLDAIFGGHEFRDPRAIDVHVHHLREKIGAAGGHPEAIVTVRGAGYRFEA